MDDCQCLAVKIEVMTNRRGGKTFKVEEIRSRVILFKNTGLESRVLPHSSSRPGAMNRLAILPDPLPAEDTVSRRRMRFTTDEDTLSALGGKQSYMQHACLAR